MNLSLNKIIDLKENDPYYFVKNSMKWIQKRINTNYIKILDLNKELNVATITTKQWRTPNAGFIKVPITKENGDLIISHNVSAIIDDNTGDIFMLRILTPRECWLIMGFEEKDYIKAVKVLKK